MLLSDGLGYEHWLAILRIGIGLWWLKSVFHKNIRKFLGGGMVNWVSDLADNHPIQPFARVIKGMVTRTSSVFPAVNLLGEFAVGVGLVLGFLTPIAALVATFMNLNYLAMAGVKPADFDGDNRVNPCFRVEQGQNWLMILGQVVIFAAGAWSVWSLDAILGLFV